MSSISPESKYRPPPPEIVAQLAASRSDMEAGAMKDGVVVLAYEDCRGLDLADACLIASTLQEAVLAGARLDRALIMGSLANGVNFDGASLVDADLAKAELVQATFIDADARNANFKKARLHRARFEGADLTGASFDHANCVEASFRKAALVGATFVKTGLSGADLTGADLAQARFDTTVITGATRFTGVSGLATVEITSVVLDGVLLGPAEALSWLRSRAEVV